MKTLDGWARPYRKLTYEFGFAIVQAMVGEVNGPLELFDILEVRRGRAQEAWLATNFITPKFRDVFQAALDRTRIVKPR